MFDIYDDLYSFEFYLKEDSAGIPQIYEEVPEKPYLIVHATELPWWKYDQLLKPCYEQDQATGDWKINQIRRWKVFFPYAVKKIETHDHEAIDGDLDVDAGQKVMQYYDHQTNLTRREMSSLKQQVEIFMDPQKTDKIKPPYDRMIVEVDVLRKMGGITREQLLHMSHKDLNKMYFLWGCGLSAPIGSIDIAPPKIMDDEDDRNAAAEAIRLNQERMAHLRAHGVIQ